jgi:hypothetical protein
VVQLDQVKLSQCSPCGAYCERASKKPAPGIEAGWKYYRVHTVSMWTTPHALLLTCSAYSALTVDMSSSDRDWRRRVQGMSTIVNQFTFAQHDAC